jgi:branched-chain amino acid transport system permease protein
VTAAVAPTAPQGRIRRGLHAVKLALRASVVDPVTPFRLPATVAGGLLCLVGVLSPWATFSGFPGEFSVGGWPPGGARNYALVLAVAAVAASLVGGGHAGVARACAVGLKVTTAYNIIAVSRAGGGAVNVGFGAWLTLVGAIVLLAVADGLPERGSLLARWRSPIPYGDALIVVASMLLLLYVVMIGLQIPDEASSQFISLLIVAISAAVALKQAGALEWLSEASARNRAVTLVAGFLVAAAFPLVFEKLFPDGNGAFWIRIAASVGVFAAAAIGLNVVVGLAGLLDLGYIAFFGVGAYVGAIFSGAPNAPTSLKLPFLVALVLGAVVAAIFGVIIGAPTLRLRGDYLAIVTLAFGEIFTIAVNNFDGSAGPDITNGPNGIPQIPQLEVAGQNFGSGYDLFGVRLPAVTNYYWAELVLLAVVILVFTRLNTSRVGRAWVAIREDETAAEAMGINTVSLKLLAFAIGAFLAGAAGTVNAHLGTTVTPNSYTFEESILLLAAIVLGGMGTVPGALLGSTFLFVLPNRLRFFSEYRILLFGLALVVMMRFRPEGIIANRRRQREFHEDEGGADAMDAPPGSPVTSEVMP